MKTKNHKHRAVARRTPSDSSESDEFRRFLLLQQEQDKIALFLLKFVTVEALGLMSDSEVREVKSRAKERTSDLQREIESIWGRLSPRFKARVTNLGREHGR